MKKFIISLSLVLITGFAFASSPLFVGNSQLNLGVGLSDRGVPIYIGFDRAVSSDVTLGAEFSYRGYREEWDRVYWDHNIIGIFGNANYHFNRILGIAPRWDFYAGLNLGYYIWSSPSKYYGSRSSSLGLGAQVGIRYYFTNSIGLNLEFGGGNAFNGGKIGVSIRL